MSHDALENHSDSQNVLNQLVIAWLREQKRKRRIRWIIRSIFLLLVVWIGFQLTTEVNEDKVMRSKPHAGLIDVNGTIFDTQGANAEDFVKSLQAAYKNEGLQAVIIRINSPGGSPVQADYMFNALQYYRKTYPHIKVYSVCVDMCASAAYYLAVGADDIYANPSSIVGSIGVVYNGFGFVEAIKKLGVERRLQTAGVNKGFLDPFLPEAREQQQFLQNILNDVHQHFIDKVKEGRGPRLKIDGSVFSGLFWTGEQAKARGLIDGFASSGQLARDILKLNMIDYTYKQSVLERMSKNIGMAMAEHLPRALGLNPGIRE